MAQGGLYPNPPMSSTSEVSATNTSSGACLRTTVEAPGEAAGTEDPEMIITSCPEWTLWVGWDRGTKRTLGNMRQQLVLNTPKAVAAFAKIFGK